MTLRERLADWISGGALTLARDEADQQRARGNRWFDDALLQTGHCAIYRGRLFRIIACETPNANATVKRMAKIAREAVK